ncbi:hypothetical protein ABGB17_23340 [Sphaerisporangium sp. B11E5]|uniref:hypothetical protein n=1 Tax=Sphaerisporangium sp. B11E5 TaxID=3153563 RepID=UPI00325D5554
MKHDPYTYITVAVEPEHDPRVSVSFRTADLHVSALVVSETRPHLFLETPQGLVSISTTGAGPVTAGDLSVAHELFQAAARYLADCERLHTPDHDQSKQADPGEKAA